MDLVWPLSDADPTGPWEARKALPLRREELAEVLLASPLEETGPAQPPQGVRLLGIGAVFSEPGVKARAGRSRGDLWCPNQPQV